MAIPISIERNIAQPGLQQANFVKYLTDAELPISTSKTIAYQSLYHVLETSTAPGPGITSANFFTGPYVATNTNFPGNTFVLPQSQHFLVTAIQGGNYSGDIGTSASFYKGFVVERQEAAVGITNAGLVGATYTFTVNGIVQQKDIPLTEFDNTLITAQRGRFELSQPILIPAQSDLQLRVTSVTGLPITAYPIDGETAQGIWFELIGIALI